MGTVIFEAGSQLTIINDNTFNSATALTSINIPASVITIDVNAFKLTTSLHTVTFETGSQLTTIGNQAFLDSGLTTVIAPHTLITNMGWTDSIGGATNSTGTPPGVTFLDPYTFYATDYAALSDQVNVTIPSTFTGIGAEAFKDATSLISVIIPSSVTTIGANVFQGTTSLATITVAEDNTTFTVVDNVLFKLDNNVTTELVAYVAAKTDTTYEIPNTVTSITSGAFYGATNLTSITFPTTVTTIGTIVFEGMTSLTTVNAFSPLISAMSWTVGENTLYGITFDVIDLSPTMDDFTIDYQAGVDIDIGLTQYLNNVSTADLPNVTYLVSNIHIYRNILVLEHYLLGGVKVLGW